MRRAPLVVAALALVSCPPDRSPDTIDPSAQDKDRALVAAAYARDPADYFVRRALPPLSRLSALDEKLGGDPMRAFAGIEPAFSAAALSSALERRLLPSEFADLVQQLLSADATPFEAWAFTTRSLVQESDAAVAELGPNAPRAAEIATMLRAVFDQVFVLASLAPLAPQADKSFATEPPAVPSPVCQAGSDAFSAAATPGRGVDDGNTQTRVPWTEIEIIPWSTTYNAACVADAVGACASKLGLIGDSPSCSDWNQISMQLGATPGESGGTQAAVIDWFRQRGFCCLRAWDGPLESACEEAQAAGARGCDVLITYFGDNGGAHMEMVRDIDVDASDSRSCRVHTLSWSKDATVTYDRGRFSRKSDAQRYRRPDQTMSYLEGSGGAMLHYYCECD